MRVRAKRTPHGLPRLRPSGRKDGAECRPPVRNIARAARDGIVENAADLPIGAIERIKRRVEFRARFTMFACKTLIFMPSAAIRSMARLCFAWSRPTDQGDVARAPGGKPPGELQPEPAQSAGNDVPSFASMTS